VRATGSTLPEALVALAARGDRDAERAAEGDHRRDVGDRAGEQDRLRGVVDHVAEAVLVGGQVRRGDEESAVQAWRAPEVRGGTRAGT
jgi:hypothetical protein